MSGRALIPARIRTLPGSPAPRSPRTVAVWCPDWPVVAATDEAGVSGHEPAAVLTGHRVVACSAAARAAGVRVGQRRREAQARCPALIALPRRPEAEARAFEPALAALESVVPGVEVLRPGLVLLPAAGPARFFGGEPAALHALFEAADPVSIHI